MKWNHNLSAFRWELWDEFEMKAWIADESIAAIDPDYWEGEYRPVPADIYIHPVAMLAGTMTPPMMPFFRQVYTPGFQDYVRDKFGLRLPDEARPG